MRIAITNVLWTGSNGTIFTGQSDNGATLTVRHLEYLVPVPGEIYEVTGSEKEYVDKRGRRHLQIDANAVSRVSTSGALLGPWLRSIPGIGEERSARLLQQFGPTLLDVLADPAKSGQLGEALAPGRPHLGQKLAALVQARYVAMRVAEATALDEASFYARLEGYGVTDRRAARSLYRLLGSTDAWGQLLQHPYSVAAVMDWKAADHLALRLLHARGDVHDPRCHRERLVGACDAAWRQILANGDTAADAGEYRTRLVRLGVNALAAQEVGVASRRIILSGSVFRAPGAARLERIVAAEFARLMASPPVAADWAPLIRCHERPVRPLTDEQRQAVVEILGRAAAVLQGGAGTGKTTTVQALVDTWLAIGGNVTLAALSGKAAIRLSRSAGRLGLTLARLVHGLERRARLVSEGRPVPEELPYFNTDTMLVVDESSMVDLATWHRVLRLLPTGARIVMVGDVAQLPPVGLGRIYHDLVEDGHLVSRLSRTMRQAEDNPIILAASLVREGIVPQLPGYAGPAQGAYLLECSMSGVETVIEGLREEMSMADGGDDVLVLAALNRTCRQVCKLMQRRREGAVPGRRLGPLAPFVAVGDPVMATRNRYDEALMNGLLGRVECLDPMLIRFDGEEEARAVSEDALAELVSAWAITGHRAQGSEARRVIVVLDAERLVTREWLYTAITRATEQVILVGTPAALRAAVGHCTVRRTGFPYELAALARRGAA